jgi:hypothetical protein
MVKVTIVSQFIIRKSLEQTSRYNNHFRTNVDAVSCSYQIEKEFRVFLGGRLYVFREKSVQDSVVIDDNECTG